MGSACCGATVRDYSGSGEGFCSDCGEMTNDVSEEKKDEVVAKIEPTSGEKFKAYLAELKKKRFEESMQVWANCYALKVARNSNK